MNYINKYLTAWMVILMSSNHASSQTNASLSSPVSTSNLNTEMHREMTEGFVRAKPAVLRELEIALPGQNIPNPFENALLIPFRIPHDRKNASIAISESARGEIAGVIFLAAGETKWTLEAGFTVVVIILILCLWMELLWIRKE